MVPCWGETAGVDGAMLGETAGVDGAMLGETAGVDGAMLGETAGVDGAMLGETVGVDGAMLGETVGVEITGDVSGGDIMTLGLGLHSEELTEGVVGVVTGEAICEDVMGGDALGGDVMGDAVEQVRDGPVERVKGDGAVMGDAKGGDTEDEQVKSCLAGLTLGQSEEIVPMDGDGI